MVDIITITIYVYELYQRRNETLYYRCIIFSESGTAAMHKRAFYAIFS